MMRVSCYYERFLDERDTGGSPKYGIAITIFLDFLKNYENLGINVSQKRYTVQRRRFCTLIKG